MPRIIVAFLSGYFSENFAYVVAIAGQTFALPSAVGFGENSMCSYKLAMFPFEICRRRLLCP
ncbi:hypothetical protein AXF42_Ash000549 [Apostasia shenzhenica]|uniref:Uncharacterized protein n=1 Tax=Apostasia shenzhenica TaxID=1088818 RepID=A0A2I0AGP3_9ASPA|nr:hypothetical protein AXF42_Ash000549 [Apostasia shenzhenica]